MPSLGLALKWAVAGAVPPSGISTPRREPG